MITEAFVLIESMTEALLCPGLLRQSKDNPCRNSSSEDGEMQGEYRVGRVLGEGGFGKVRLGTHIFSGKKVFFGPFANLKI